VTTILMIFVTVNCPNFIPSPFEVDQVVDHTVVRC